MAIIPTIRCSNLTATVEFYTKVLDFNQPAQAGDLSDPGFAALTRGDDWLYLSSHAGDGVFGQAVAVIDDNIDALFEKFLSRGLVRPDRDSPVHQGPTDQTWGTREFYVDDPDGNTLRFTQPPRLGL